VTLPIRPFVFRHEMPGAMLRRNGPKEWQELSATALTSKTNKMITAVLTTAGKVWADAEMSARLIDLPSNLFRSQNKWFLAMIEVITCLEQVKTSHCGAVCHYAHCVILACVPVLHKFLVSKTQLTDNELFPHKPMDKATYIIEDVLTLLDWLSVPHEGSLPDLTSHVSSINLWFDWRPKQIPILHILSKMLPQRCQYRNLYSVSNFVYCLVNIESGTRPLLTL
jgi:hypothetical protein